MSTVIPRALSFIVRDSSETGAGYTKRRSENRRYPEERTAVVRDGEIGQKEKTAGE